MPDIATGQVFSILFKESPTLTDAQVIWAGWKGRFGQIFVSFEKYIVLC